MGRKNRVLTVSMNIGDEKTSPASTDSKPAFSILPDKKWRFNLTQPPDEKNAAGQR